MKPSALPVTPRAFHEFYRAPAFRWWKPLAGIAAVAVAWLVVCVIVMVPFLIAEFSSGELTPEQLLNGQLPGTVLIFLANNLTIVAFIPLAIVGHRVFFGQKTGWLASITGRFRWRLFGRCLLIALPFFAVLFGLNFVTDGVPTLSVDAHTVPMIVIILLTTPLQCAGEEYAIRGFLGRAVGSWFGLRNAGWIVSTIVSTGVFVWLHDAQDPWLNLFYGCFAVIASVLVWRTGGLEAGIALHIMNNLMSLALAPFMDISGMFDRQAGTGSPTDLIQVAFVVVPAAIIIWQAKRLELPTATAPAAPLAGDVPPPGTLPPGTFPPPGAFPPPTGLPPSDDVPRDPQLTGMGETHA